MTDENIKLSEKLSHESIFFKPTKKEDLDELFKELRNIYEGLYDGVYEEIRYNNFYEFLKHFVDLFKYEKDFIERYSTSS